MKNITIYHIVFFAIILFCLPRGYKFYQEVVMKDKLEVLTQRVDSLYKHEADIQKRINDYNDSTEYYIDRYVYLDSLWLIDNTNKGINDEMNYISDTLNYGMNDDKIRYDAKNVINESVILTCDVEDFYVELNSKNGVLDNINKAVNYLWIINIIIGCIIVFKSLYKYANDKSRKD